MKKQVLWIALDAIFLIVFNVCFFVLLGGVKERGIEGIPPSVWVSYGFIHFSYLLLLFTPLLVRRGNKAVADYARPLYVGTWIYFLVALVVNLVFILVSLNSTLVQLFQQLQLSPKSGLLAWLVNRLVNADGITAAWLLNLLGSPISTGTAWVVNVILAGLAAIYLIANGLVNEDTAEKQERHEQELVYVKTAAPRLKALVDSATDKKVEAELEKLYYTINSSPLRSNEAAKSLERQVLMMLNDLEEATDKEDTLRICDEMVKLANRRNRMLNTNN